MPVRGHARATSKVRLIINSLMPSGNVQILFPLAKASSGSKPSKSRPSGQKRTGNLGLKMAAPKAAAPVYYAPRDGPVQDNYVCKHTNS